MALSANRKIPTMLQVNTDGGGVILDVPVAGSAEIYEGAFVSFAAADKYLNPLVAGEVPSGIALQRISGGASDGLKTCKVACGAVFEHALASLAVANQGADVFASADDTLTLVSTSNSHIGWCINVPASGRGIFKLHMPGMAP